MANGTYIAISVSDQYFNAAADSRGLDSGGRRSDDFCKIRILGGNVVFLQMGYMTRREDAIDRAYYGIADAHAISKIASAWADAISPEFSDIPRNERMEMFNHYPGHEATTGFFAGTDYRGKILVEGIKILFDDITGEQSKLRKEPFPVRPIANSPIQGPGSHPDLYQEFLFNMTARARAANRAVDEVRGVSDVERMALRTRALVKFMIDYANDESIGGSAYAVILERGSKSAKWFPFRPDFCPAN